jgi:hypothetical protein
VTIDFSPNIAEMVTDYEPQKTLNVFDKMIVIIKKRGHTKGYWEDSKGRVCIVGALREALTGQPKATRALTSGQLETSNMLDKYLGGISEELFGVDRGYSESVQVFNEHPQTTQKEVEQLLREASSRYDAISTG